LRLGDDLPSAVAPIPEKTAAPAGMAGDATLLDEQQQRVAVTIQAQFAQPLNLSRGLALAPKPLARTRPITGAALGKGRAHRIAVHPSVHQDFAGVVLLHDGRHQAVGAESDLGQRYFDWILHLWCPSLGCRCLGGRMRLARWPTQVRF